MTLILHPLTEKSALSITKNPPHALLITGQYGIGASTLAMHIAKQLSPMVTTVLPEKDDKIDLDKGTITVGLVRRLYEQTRTKSASRIILIDYAERMAPTAQNAFLKLLEEPTPGTMFILVSHEASKLLPTVKSRVQRFDMHTITLDQSKQLLDILEVTDPTKRMQLLYMASGLPAELTKLASDQAYFERGADIVRDAKALLQAETYKKLLVAHKYKDDRAAALRLLEIAMNMLRQSLSNEQPIVTTKKLDHFLDVYDRLSANGNIRLQLARAVL